MMSISLQLSVNASPADALVSKSQSVDADAAPSATFGEILKVEEKKLQQEVNPLSAAALLATIHAPLLTESLAGLNLESEPLAPSAPPADSVKPTTPQPQQDTVNEAPRTLTNQFTSNTVVRNDIPQPQSNQRDAIPPHAQPQVATDESVKTARQTAVVRSDTPQPDTERQDAILPHAQTQVVTDESSKTSHQTAVARSGTPQPDTERRDSIPLHAQTQVVTNETARASHETAVVRNVTPQPESERRDTIPPHAQTQVAQGMVVEEAPEAVEQSASRPVQVIEPETQLDRTQVERVVAQPSLHKSVARSETPDSQVENAKIDLSANAPVEKNPVSESQHLGVQPREEHVVKETKVSQELILPASNNPKESNNVTSKPFTEVKVDKKQVQVEQVSSPVDLKSAGKVTFTHKVVVEEMPQPSAHKVDARSEMLDTQVMDEEVDLSADIAIGKKPVLESRVEQAVKETEVSQKVSLPASSEPEEYDNVTSKPSVEVKADKKQIQVEEVSSPADLKPAGKVTFTHEVVVEEVPRPSAHSVDERIEMPDTQVVDEKVDFSADVAVGKEPVPEPQITGVQPREEQAVKDTKVLSKVTLSASSKPEESNNIPSESAAEGKVDKKQVQVEEVPSPVDLKPSVTTPSVREIVVEATPRRVEQFAYQPVQAIEDETQIDRMQAERVVTQPSVHESDARSETPEMQVENVEADRPADAVVQKEIAPESQPIDVQPREEQAVKETKVSSKVTLPASGRPEASNNFPSESAAEVKVDKKQIQVEEFSLPVDLKPAAKTPSVHETVLEETLKIIEQSVSRSVQVSEVETQIDRAQAERVVTQSSLRKSAVRSETSDTEVENVEVNRPADVVVQKEVAPETQHTDVLPHEERDVKDAKSPQTFSVPEIDVSSEEVETTELKPASVEANQEDDSVELRDTKVVSQPVELASTDTELKVEIPSKGAPHFAKLDEAKPKTSEKADASRQNVASVEVKANEAHAQVDEAPLTNDLKFNAQEMPAREDPVVASQAKPEIRVNADLADIQMREAQVERAETQPSARKSETIAPKVEPKTTEVAELDAEGMTSTKSDVVESEFTARTPAPVENLPVAQVAVKADNAQDVAPLTDQPVSEGRRVETVSRPKVQAGEREDVPQPSRVEKKSLRETAQVEVSPVVNGVKHDGIVTASKPSMGQAKPLDVEVVQQVVSQLKPHIKSGETSMRLRLDPGELGSIEVEMVRHERGVSVSFVTEQVSTGQLLESHVDQLRQSLKEAGVQLANLNISQHQQPKQEGGAFRQEPQMVTERREVPQQGTNEERPRPPLTRGPHEVDYLI